MKKKFLIYILFAMTFNYSPTNVSGQTNRPKARLNHIAIYVNDLKKSSDFYSHIIGLDTIPEPFHDGKHTWFSVGDKSHLHVIQGAAAGLTYEKNNHLCFSVTTVENFISVLDKNNVEYENWPGQKKSIQVRPDGVKQIWFKDPDGHWIEINDAKE
jgi:lactoylglutathione lyase